MNNDNIYFAKFFIILLIFRTWNCDTFCAVSLFEIREPASTSREGFKVFLTLGNIREFLQPYNYAAR